MPLARWVELSKPVEKAGPAQLRPMHQIAVEGGKRQTRQHRPFRKEIANAKIEPNHTLPADSGAGAKRRRAAFPERLARGLPTVGDENEMRAVRR